MQGTRTHTRGNNAAILATESLPQPPSHYLGQSAQPMTMSEGEFQPMRQSVDEQNDAVIQDSQQVLAVSESPAPEQKP